MERDLSNHRLDRLSCYLLYESSENSLQHIEFSHWKVYIVKTNDIQKWTNELKQKTKKYFVQTEEEIYYNFSNNNLYKSLFNNFPLSWVQFIFQNEMEILQLSQDLSLIEDEEEVEIFPKVSDVFKIFRLLKPRQIKVIIIGQDPYPQKNVADGVAFSTFASNSVPASLKNIFLELTEYENINSDKDNPDLVRWVKQGCFLINSAWTVSENKTGSHGNLWKQFVESLIRYVLEINREKNIIIAFFGSEAKTKFKNIAKSYSNSILLEVPHPSPNCSEKGFFNSQIFTNINSYLTDPINWI